MCATVRCRFQTDERQNITMAKLILVEGLPGSGKSTTAKTIHAILTNQNIDAQLFCEGSLAHPADFEGVAWFGVEDFNDLKKNHSSFSDVLDEMKVENDEGVFIPYRRLVEEKRAPLDDALLHHLSRNDVYELPLERHIELIAARWEAFVRAFIDCDHVVIFECCFIQNPVTVTMIRDGELREMTRRYIGRLADIIRPLDPLLVYVEQDCIEQSFRKAIAERPEEWIKGFETYYTGQGYGLQHNFKGIEGVIQVLKERRTVERAICESLELDCRRINNSSFDQGELEKQLHFVLSSCFSCLGCETVIG